VPDRGRLTAGLRLAVTTLTVAPIRPGPVDREAAAVAMSVAPAVGAALGVAVAAVGVGAVGVGATPFLAAVLAVSAGVGLTRGLHVDGLADTADALGSYRDPDIALAIMKKPDLGPLGVTAIVLALLAQVAALTTVLARPWYAAAAGVVAATATGRLAVAVACRRGVPAARPEGLGSLVAGIVGPFALVLGALAVAGVAAGAVPGRPWQGPLAVGIALVTVLLLLRHTVRRLGGITGDVLGAVCELAVTATYVAISM
jgi:adenosylcobinamide-GDP ribazoletransferase